MNLKKVYRNTGNLERVPPDLVKEATLQVLFGHDAALRPSADPFVRGTRRNSKAEQQPVRGCSQPAAWQSKARAFRQRVFPSSTDRLYSKQGDRHSHRCCRERRYSR